VLYEQGRYRDAERFISEAIEISEGEPPWESWPRYYWQRAKCMIAAEDLAHGAPSASTREVIEADLTVAITDFRRVIQEEDEGKMVREWLQRNGKMAMLHQQSPH
jgi:hypothetical protein